MMIATPTRPAVTSTQHPTAMWFRAQFQQHENEEDDTTTPSPRPWPTGRQQTLWQRFQPRPPNRTFCTRQALHHANTSRRLGKPDYRPTRTANRPQTITANDEFTAACFVCGSVVRIAPE